LNSGLKEKDKPDFIYHDVKTVIDLEVSDSQKRYHFLRILDEKCKESIDFYVQNGSDERKAKREEIELEMQANYGMPFIPNVE
jgi:hypothetical protein